MANNAKPRTYSNPPHALQEPLARHVKDLANWVVWKWAKNNKGEWTKPPFIANDAHGRFAKNNDPSTWRSYDQACTVDGKADGIGFMLLGTDIGAFDVDDCRNPVSGFIHPFALELIRRANSYTE